MAKSKKSVTVTTESSSTPAPESEAALKIIKKAEKKATKNGLVEHVTTTAEGHLDLSAMDEQYKKDKKKVAKRLAQHSIILAHQAQQIGQLKTGLKVVGGATAILVVKGAYDYMYGNDNQDDNA